MTSFAAAIEPPAQPRLAGGLLLLHAFAAASPWLTHSSTPLAVALSLLAIAGLVATIGRVPGRHCTLAAIAHDGDGWRARLAGERAYVPARLGSGARAYASLIVLEVVVGRRRFGWLLPRSALSPAEFRRLKARIRLTC